MEQPFQWPRKPSRTTLKPSNTVLPTNNTPPNKPVSNLLTSILLNLGRIKRRNPVVWSEPPRHFHRDILLHPPTTTTTTNKPILQKPSSPKPTFCQTPTTNLISPRTSGSFIHRPLCWPMGAGCAECQRRFQELEEYKQAFVIRLCRVYSFATGVLSYEFSSVGF